MDKIPIVSSVWETIPGRAARLRRAHRQSSLHAIRIEANSLGYVSVNDLKAAIRVLEDIVPYSRHWSQQILITSEQHPHNETRRFIVMRYEDTTWNPASPHSTSDSSEETSPTPTPTS